MQPLTFTVLTGEFTAKYRRGGVEPVSLPDVGEDPGWFCAGPDGAPIDAPIDKEEC